MLRFGILEMDMTPEAFFAVLTIYINCVSGLVLPTPENLTVDIWDGEATAYWSSPTTASADFRYNVEMAIYDEEWGKVDTCTSITSTSCDLSKLTQEYNLSYKLRVQLVVGKNASAWIATRFQPNECKLRPPVFTLCPSSSSLMVLVKKNPIFPKLFPFGVIYSIYLEQRGEGDKNITALLKAEEQSSTTFKFLHQGAEYCVSARVQYQGSPASSSVSPKQCVLLPEQEWHTIVVTSLSLLAVLGFASIIAVFLFFCYLRRPEKTPDVLKLPVSGWLPLAVGDGTIEVVTDKGWFLSSSRPEVKSQFPVTDVTPKEHKVEGRRTSMDSGVSVEPNPAEISRGIAPERHDDSGCGSLSGSESSASNHSDYPLTDDKARNGMDSRVDLECQLRSSSANLDGEDSASPKATVAVGNYRSQSPSAELDPILCRPVMAEVLSGYRHAAQVCICSGAGQCTWCHKQVLNRKGLARQYTATCTDNGLHSSKQDTVDFCKAVPFLGYSQKTHVDSFRVEDKKSAFIHLEETFPMLTALAAQDINMNFSLSLCDVQMEAD